MDHATDHRAVGESDPPCLEVGGWRLARRWRVLPTSSIFHARSAHDVPALVELFAPGLVDAAGLDRLERVTPDLLMLGGPGIAQVLDVGYADLGSGPQPYVVTETVDGAEPLDVTEHRGLDARERLAMMSGVCAAVARAHAMGLAHGALLPERIVAPEVDGSVQPVVLGLGVLTAVGGDHTGLSAEPTVDDLIDRAPYVCPEMRRGETKTTDPMAADVYALGAMMVAVIGGEPPVELGMTTSGGLPQLPPPVVELGGGLASILATALAPEPAHRYRDAAALSADLCRWQRGDARAERRLVPNAAAPSSPFVHWKTAMATAAVLCLAFGFYLVLRPGNTNDAATVDALRRARDAEVALSASRADGERLRAELDDVRTAAADAEARVLARPMEVAPQPEPKKTPVASPPPKIETEVESEPAIEVAAAPETDTAGPRPFAPLSVEPASARPPRAPQETAALRAVNDLAERDERDGRGIEAVAMRTALMRAHRTRLGDEHATTLAAIDDLARLHVELGQLAEAEALVIKAMSIRERLYGEHDVRTLATADELAMILVLRLRAAEAVEQCERILAARTAEDPRNAVTRGILGCALVDDDGDRAASLLEASWPLIRDRPDVPAHLRRHIGAAHGTMFGG